MKSRELEDRLVDFVRGRNHELLDAFDSLRAACIVGAMREAVALAATWRDQLAKHICWEENWLLDEYGGRSRATDIPEIAAHVAEHERLLDLADRLTEALSGGAMVARATMRGVLDAIDVTLLDHKEREENEVCVALDHVLDAPRRRAIERALAA